MRILQKTLVTSLSVIVVVSGVSANGREPVTQMEPDQTEETSQEQIGDFLPAATLAESLVIQKKRAEDQPDNQSEKFRLGMMQFLRAIEGLGQDHYRYGFNSGTSFSIPLMRLPVPRNNDPEKLTYKEARSIVRRLLKRLSAAQQTLASIKTDGTEIRVPVDLTKLSLDLNNDKAYSDKELSLIHI